MLKDKHLAEESARDVLSKSFEKLSKFKGQSTFSSWLYSITYNHCIDYMRLKKRLHYPDWNKKHDIPEIIDDSDDDFPEVSYAHLTKVLEMIHPEEKALLLMRYEYNLPFKQIGMSLRISESAAKMRIKRAKARVLYYFKNIEEKNLNSQET
jgi:RNA polymerase sigma-70 factor (ECF subfamily)